MSFREGSFLKFQPEEPTTEVGYLENRSGEDVRELFLKVLNHGIHGFCYSIYEEGQKPGDTISEEQIRRRMAILKPHTHWVRSFSCVEGNELIPKVAKELGIKTLVGAWLGSDRGKNQKEIENLIRLAENGLVDIAVVGNEVLYRNDLTLDDLLVYIRGVREVLPNIPVGYVDAYYEFAQRPQLSDACDIILSNCYPFWEGTAFEHSLSHMKQMFRQALEAGKGKRVIVTETGWPSSGGGLGNAYPSVQNAMKYFINAHIWSREEGVEIFHFSSFDESWKVGVEGDVGAHWGIWDKSGKLKF